jgi:redox-sensitive bicupin YhaK (pirin superfamily)
MTITEPKTLSRRIVGLVPATRTFEGDGFPIRRPFPTSLLSDLDPFLMLDEVGPVEWAPGEARGAPDHPHRGFETISYILSGEKRHEDSTGKSQVLKPGDVQWMTAGAGIIHSELPTERFRAAGGLVHSFQIWVNLPAAEKFAEPGYQYVPAAAIPVATMPGGQAVVRVIAGSAGGVDGAVRVKTPVTLQDWTMPAHAHAELATVPQHAAAVYVFEGSLELDPAAAPVSDGELAVMGKGGRLEFRTTDDAARFLVLGGQPIAEPIARYGPFVMNTRDELVQAFDDYRSGRMGEIVRGSGTGS